MVVINIDTNKDSKDDIKKTIAYLQSLVGEESRSGTNGFSNPFSDSEKENQDHSEANLFGMFDNRVEESIGETNKTGDSAEDLLQEDFVEVESGKDEEVEIVDDQEDAVVEIVEY